MATIMVVDDRSGIRRLLYEVLTDAGYNVIVAAGGKEAMEKIEEHTVDLVLLDMKMSGMNGLQTLIKMKEYNPEVLILIMTAYEEPEILREALRMGSCGHITKPFDLIELKGIIAGKLRAASA